MTRKEHIVFWDSQVDRDYDSALVLYRAEYWAQALYLAHLALEKVLKALWVKYNHTHGVTPPFENDLLHLVRATKESFSQEQKKFFKEMNANMLRNEFADFGETLDKKLNKERCQNFLQQSDEIITLVRQKLY